MLQFYFMIDLCLLPKMCSFLNYAYLYYFPQVCNVWILIHSHTTVADHVLQDSPEMEPIVVILMKLVPKSKPKPQSTIDKDNFIVNLMVVKPSNRKAIILNVTNLLSNNLYFLNIKLYDNYQNGLY